MTKLDIRKVALICILLMGSVNIVLAQDEGDDLELIEDQNVLEEIIVTARKRQESLQDSPVAISALGVDALKEAGISNMRDLQKVVPGLNFAEQGSKVSSIYIRGVGQRESNAALDPGVGVYINGIFIARTDGQLLDTVDTENIQVLRGPQGTLFGKNNTGGAILVTTIAPHTEGFDGYISTRMGNFGRLDAKLGANIPLNDDSLAMRISVNSTKRDGYLKNIYDGKEYGDEDRLAATARFYWQATDFFNVDVFTYWSKQNELGAGFSCLFQRPIANIPSFAWPGDPKYRSMQERCEISESLVDDNKIALDGPSVFTITNKMAALTLAWEYDDYEIKSISAWSHQSDLITENDQDGTDATAMHNGTISLHETLRKSIAAGYSTFSQPDDEERTQVSQELHFIGSAFDESLSYTIGVFYAKEEMKDTIFSQLIGPNGYGLYTDIPGLNLALPKLLGTHSDLDNETYAFFAQSTYDVNDWFQLTAGIRYTAEDRERTATIYEANCAEVTNLIPGSSDGFCGSLKMVTLDDQAALDAFLLGPPGYLPVDLVEELETVPDTPDVNDIDGDGDTTELISRTILAPGGIISDDDTFTKVTPTVTASFDIPEELFEDMFIDSTLTYLTWSKGFKAGGFDMKGLELVKFDEEEVTNIELGMKMDTFGHRLRINTALYRMDYDDMQVRIATQGVAISDIYLFISNAGSATIQGFEMEVTALPADNLTLQLTVGYTDASYDDFEPNIVDLSSGFPVEKPFDRSDEDFGNVPELTYSITAMYNFNTDIGLFVPRLSVYFRDDMYIGIDEVAPQYDSATLDDMTLVSFRLAYIHEDSGLELTLFVENLTDEDYFQGGFSQSSAMGAATVIQGPPRTYGLEASYNF